MSFGFIILIYANSFNGTWQYDDSANIVENKSVHLDSFSLKALKNSLFRASPLGAHRIQRPLAYLSFALNHYWGDLDPWGYHLVNLIIHLTASVLLFLFIYELLNAPRIASRYGDNARWIALVAALLWAAHPIQVTAVTYIVQRMAGMAAMFTILSMYLFLKARLAGNASRKYWFYGFAGLAYLAGLATKENVVLLPVCMLLLDLGVISGTERFSLKKAARVYLPVLILIVLLIAVVAGMGKVTLLMESFPNRPYTPIQRLLTQPRVIWLYLAWIFVPMRSHLTLLHDIDYSVNLLNPVTTLPALVLLIGATFSLLILLKRHPLPAFCGLFFVINHLVEASFLNLGLVYEHRNYLPSMLLFVMPAAWLIQFLKRNELSKGLRIGCMTALVLFAFSNGHTVYNYNKAFLSEWNLWFDVISKSPGLSVAHGNLGKALWNLGAFEKGYQQFQKAYDLNHYNDRSQKGMVYHNLGLYHAYVKEDNQKALSLFENAFTLVNGFPDIWYQRARANLLLGNGVKADDILSDALNIWPDNGRLSMAKVVVKLVRGDLDKALQHAHKTREISPMKPQLLFLLGEIYRRKGTIDRSDAFFNDYFQIKMDEEGESVNTKAIVNTLKENSRHYALELLKLGVENELGKKYLKD